MIRAVPRPKARGAARRLLVLAGALVVASVLASVLGPRLARLFAPPPAPESISGSSGGTSGHDHLGAETIPQRLAPGSGGRSASAPETATPAAASLEPADAGRRLDVRVVDERTGDAIGDLELVLYREPGVTKLLLQATTDARGRASFAGPELDTDVLLVESRRREPYAPRLGAAWVPEGRRAELELRVGTGGLVQGRVVDDTQQPLEGVELFADERSLGMSPLPRTNRWGPDPLAVTDREGRFAIPALRSRPSGVWIVEGKPRPERWDPVRLQARLFDAAAQAEVHVDEGATQTVEDIVLERARTYAGRVLDEHGAPVAGALVSPFFGQQLSLLFGTNCWISKRAWEGLEPLAGEVWTPADGSFRVARCTRPWRLAVLVADGRAQVFDVPELAPGEQTSGVELRLRPETRLMVSFDPPLDETPRIYVRLADGRQPGLIPTSRREDRAAPIETRWPAAPAELVALTVRHVGYHPFEHVFDTPPRSGDTLTVRLEKRPTIRLGLLPERAVERAVNQRIRLRACLAREAHELCCGYGHTLWSNIPPEGAEVELEVAREDAYYVHALHLMARDEVTTLGPYRPGFELHEVAFLPRPIATEDAEDTGPGSAAAADKRPPEVLLPSDLEVARLGTLRLRTLDASSNAPVEAHVKLLRDAQRQRYWTIGTSDEDGRFERKRLEAGALEIQIEAEGYEIVQAIPFELEGDAVRDLGDVHMTPREVWRVQIDAPAEDEGAKGYVNLATVGGQFLRGHSYTAGVPLSLGADVPEELLLTITANREVDHSPTLTGLGAIGYVSNVAPVRCAQRVRLARWPSDRVETLRAGPWRPLQVSVEGLAPELADTSLRLVVDYPAASPLAVGGEALQTLAESREAPGRVFETLLAPGNYVLHVHCALYDFAPLEFAVRPGLDLQTLVAVPR